MPSTLPATDIESQRIARTREQLRQAIAPGTSIDSALSAVAEVYAASDGDPARVPWSHEKANPALVAWLNARASGLVRCGARVAVVGCGLGQDAIELAKRGYDVCAFDACNDAIEHAKRRHPDRAAMFRVADLRDLPSTLHHRFDLVVEIHTLQALPPEHRATLASGVARLMASHAHLLVIARGRPDDEPLVSLSGPPYPFTPGELIGLLGDSGLVPEGAIDDYADDANPPTRRLRGLFRRDTGVS